MPKADDPMLPTPLGLVICKSISHDIDSGEAHLHGLFGYVAASEVPALVNFAIYGTFTGIRKELSIHFVVVDAKENELIATKPKTYPESTDILAEGIAAEYIHFEFPRYGQYFVRLMVDGMYIMERRLVVIDRVSPLEMED